MLADRGEHRHQRRQQPRQIVAPGGVVRSGDPAQPGGDQSAARLGRLGEDRDLDYGVAAARACGLNLIAQMKAACDGDLSRVVRVVKLGGFVQAGPDFTAIPGVINGCSDLMVEVFGDAGRHARSAVGVYKLPLGFAVEVDAIVEIR